MLYSEFITILRRETRDHGIPAHDYGTGDGVWTAFELTEKPVLEDSYTVKQSTTTLAENVDYTFDKESGWIVFNPTIANGTGITVDYKHVNVTDTGYIQIINDVISDLDNYGYFKSEVVDDTTLTTVADQIEYTCPTGCKDICNAWYKTGSTTSYDWYPLGTTVNWRYNRETNTLYLGRDMTAGYPIKIQYLSKYTLYTNSTDTIDLNDQYINILKLGCLARYYEQMIGTKMNISTKISKEVTVTPMQNIQSLVSHYEKRYEAAKVKSKPMPPSITYMPIIRNGGVA